MNYKLFLSCLHILLHGWDGRNDKADMLTTQPPQDMARAPVCKAYPKSFLPNTLNQKWKILHASENYDMSALTRRASTMNLESSQIFSSSCLPDEGWSFQAMVSRTCCNTLDRNSSGCRPSVSSSRYLSYGRSDFQASSATLPPSRSHSGARRKHPPTDGRYRRPAGQLHRLFV